MSNCALCGKPALPLLSVHPKCRKANREAAAELLDLADRALAGGASSELQRAVERLERDGFLGREQRGTLLRSRFEQKVREALEDNVLTVEEEAQLVEFTESFALGRTELDADGWYTRFVQSAALRDLLHGKLPPSVLPMKLEPDEALIWMFPTAQRTEGEIAHAAHDAAGAGAIRVSHGLYFRTGAARAKGPEMTVQRPIDSGSLAVTNRFAHFSGRRSRFRIPLEEIEHLEPTTRGVTFERHLGGGKSEGFETGDGWFLMNLLSNARNARMG